MYFPLISTRKSKRSPSLERRKGGGGKGGGTKGSGDSGGSSSSGSSSSSSSSGAGRSSPISSGGTSRTASSTSNGGGQAVTIPNGQPFAGRQSGGATRGDVYGNQVYGSGYPGISGRGVANRGFPFVFWPLAWGGVAGAGGAAYLHSNEYGRPDNTTRPGGPLFTTTIPSSSSNSTFRLLSDNTTVTSLLASIQSNCSSLITSTPSNSSSLNGTPLTPIPYNDTTPLPVPEQVVQYYRASSVALTLDGYNDTSALSSDENAAPVPLPGWVDNSLLGCLNGTIGMQVPLVDSGAVRGMGMGGGGGMMVGPGVVGVLLVWVLLGVL